MTEERLKQITHPGPLEVELLAEVLRLRAALERYGRHETGPDGCRYSPCTCGLGEVLGGLR